MHSQPSLTALKPSPCSTLSATETTSNPSRVNLHHAVQQAPAPDVFAPASQEHSPLQVNKPNTLPSQTQTSAPSTSPASLSPTTIIPFPHPITHTSSATLSSQPPPRAMPSASEAQDVKTSMLMITDAGKMPPSTQAIAAVCLI